MVEDVMLEGKGVCQDYVYIMILVVWVLGFLVCYVLGYFLMDDCVDQDVIYVWCEIYVIGLGWVGFDVFNGILFDFCYIIVVIG